MKPIFEATDDGVDIIDQVERHRYRLTTHDPVTLEAVALEQIPYPVDAATQFSTETLTLPTTETVHVRGQAGAMIERVRPMDQIVLENDTYTLELSSPMKLYICVDGTVHIYSDPERTYLAFDGETQTVVGARSYHTRPAGTITTPTEPEAVMEAVTLFGSALKTTRPDRSYPTLRGHPPALAIGDRISAPEWLERTQTGIRLEAPPTLESVFVVTPLTYYLGAELVPGSTPRLVTASGYSYPLDGSDGFEATVERVLKHVFFLDCVVRTEGLTPLSLAERDAIEPRLPFDITTVYEQPPDERLEAYLDVSFSQLESIIPEWRLEVRLEPTPESVPFLPFISDDLAIVRVGTLPSEPTTESMEAATEAINTFTRNGTVHQRNTLRGGSSDDASARENIQTLTQRWRQNESPDIVSDTPLSTFRNRIGQTPRADPIDIEVVCNDVEMRDELTAVNGVYGTRAELPFDVTTHYDITTTELESVMMDASDFFHYIGHIDREGIQCSDGKLDASTLDSVGTKAFLLNGCQSHDQGLYLIEAGSIGGIVTLTDIGNSGAISVGSTIARLLNRGFPLYAALELAQEQSISGHQYRLVGDGATTIAQTVSGSPYLPSVLPQDDTYQCSIHTYLTSSRMKGALFAPHIDAVPANFLVNSGIGPFSLTRAQLRSFLELETTPVRFDGKIRWSSDVISML